MRLLPSYEEAPESPSGLPDVRTWQGDAIHDPGCCRHLAGPPASRLRSTRAAGNGPAGSVPS